MITFNSLNTTKSQTQNNNTHSSKPSLNMRAGLKQDRVSFSSSKNPQNISPGLEIFAKKIIEHGKVLIEKGEALLRGKFTGDVIDLDTNFIHHFEGGKEFEKTSFRLVPEKTYSFGEIEGRKIEFRETDHRFDGTARKTYLYDSDKKNLVGEVYHDIKGQPRLLFKIVPDILPIGKASELTIYDTSGRHFVEYKNNDEGEFCKISYKTRPPEIVKCDYETPDILRKQIASLYSDENIEFKIDGKKIII